MTDRTAMANGSEHELTEEAMKGTTLLHNFPILVPLGLGHEEPSALSDSTSAQPITVHLEWFGELAEHAHLGDGIKLQQLDDESKKEIAINMKLVLPNNLSLTYGEINWLAGDFYGTKTPISDGSAEDNIANFRNAFATLAYRDKAKAEAEQLLVAGQAEIKAVNKALKEHKDPSKTAYRKASFVDPDSFTWIWDTWDRSDGEGYLGLALTNFDHFGEDARKAYTAGHYAALEAARQGDLQLAYAMNAFADHFLQDSFSAGHMRTPRRFLHTGYTPDAGNVCAKYMHDEDSAIGLDVTDPDGKIWWHAYGDKRILDTEDDYNERRCKQAVQASVDEVIEAFNTGKFPEDIGQAWKFAPTIESACDMDKQKLSPLFTPDGQVRDNINDRTDKRHHPGPSYVVLGRDFEYDVWFASISTKCWWSGLWKEDKLHT